MKTLLIVIIALIVIATILYFIYKNRLSSTPSDEWEDLRMNKKSNISDKQYRQLLLGAIFAQQQMAYQNSLETDIDNKTDIAENWWSIYTREDALETLDRLYENSIKLLHDNSFIKSVNFNACYDELIELGVIRSVEEAENLGISAWNSGRLAFMTRLCYDLGYISEEEAWAFMQKAYDVSKSRFDSWDSFGRSYVLGRSVWAGTEMMNDIIIDHMKILLTDPASPWRKIAW